MVEVRVPKAFRQSFRDPLLALPCLVLLALGIGAVAAGVSVLASSLVDPTPFTQADRLVRIWGSEDGSRNRGGVSYGLLDSSTSGALEEIGIFAGHTSTWQPSPETRERVRSGSLSAGMLATLQVAPIAGRGFTDQEFSHGGSRAVLVREDVWRRLGQGTAYSTGFHLHVDGSDWLVVGVLPEDFRFPHPATKLWFPASQGPYGPLVDQESGSFGAIGRLREGARITVLDQQLAALASSRSHADSTSRRTAWAEPLDQVYLQQVEEPLRLLGIGVALLFVAAVSNLGILQLARSLSRSRDSAIRFALGATGQKLARSFAADALILTTLAALLSLPIGSVFVARVTEASTLGWAQGGIALDLRAVIMGWALGFVVFWALSFLSLSAARNPMAALRGKVAVNLKAWQRMATLQLSVAFLFVLTAISFYASYRLVSAIDLGFEPEDFYYSEVIMLPRERYLMKPAEPASWEANHQAARQVLGNLRRTPGLESSTLGMVHPTSPGWEEGFTIAGVTPRQPRVRVRVVAEDYFEISGIPVLSGRGIEVGDVVDRTPVAVLNEKASRAFFAGESPIGRSIEIMGMSRQIVGVVGNVPFLGLEQPEVPAVYTSYFQTPAAWFFVLSRTELDRARADAAIRSAVTRMDPGLSVPEIEWVTATISDQLALVRSGAVLSTSIASVVVLLALLGLYGLLRASAISSEREMAIRLALGAPQRSVAMLILSRAAKYVGLGVAVGSAGAWLLEKFWLSTVVSSKVGLEMYLATALICGVVGILASVGPAIRTRGIRPASTLKSVE